MERIGKFIHKHTPLHELGHGMFTLHHSFEQNYGGSGSKTATKNLMDYAAGTELAAWQWAVMANPAVITAFDGAEDGLAVGNYDGLIFFVNGYWNTGKDTNEDFEGLVVEFINVIKYQIAKAKNMGVSQTNYWSSDFIENAKIFLVPCTMKQM